MADCNIGCLKCRFRIGVFYSAIETAWRLIPQIPCPVLILQSAYK